MQVTTKPVILEKPKELTFKDFIKYDIKYDQTDLVELMFDSGIFDIEYIINYDYILYPKVRSKVKQWLLVSPRLAGELIKIGEYVYCHRDRNEETMSKSHFWGRQVKSGELEEDDKLIEAFIKMCNVYN